MGVSMVLTFVAIVGTQSRGAFVGVIVMVGYLIIKSRRRGALVLVLVLLAPATYMFMPESWHERMDTIETYEKDKSAMGRINAWWTAWNLAVDRPIVGGGFEAFQWRVFQNYSPNPRDTRDVHSIYFEALGEHGFVGLFLFLTLGLLGLVTANRIIRETKNEPRLFWMRDLASMIHVSLIGYAASGAFLGLAYFDFYYTLLATLVGVQSLLARYRAEGLPETETALSPGRSAGGLTVERPATAARTAGPRRQVSSLDAIKAWYEKL
jgi:probable O-glycosylation ligase (exosortase A-associated)